MMSGELVLLIKQDEPLQPIHIHEPHVVAKMRIVEPQEPVPVFFVAVEIAAPNAALPNPQYFAALYAGDVKCVAHHRSIAYAHR